MSNNVELEPHRVKLMSRAEYPTTDTAASWYVVMQSTELKKDPVEVKMFGRPLVAWRDGSGRAVIMERYCSHQGASLARGKVVDGCLQCPFHNWHFDSAGACVMIPGKSQKEPRLEPIPRTARQVTYPTIERYGYVWVWYGSKAPLHPLPEVPADDSARDGYKCLKIAYETRTSVLRIVENFYDAQHAVPVHGLPVTFFDLAVVDDHRNSKLNVEALARAGAWFGGTIEMHVDRYFGVTGTIFRALGLSMSKMSLFFDGYPGGCVMTVLFDGDEKFKVLQCVTPIDKEETRLHATIMVKKGDKFWRNVANYILFGLQTRVSVGDDVALWNAMKPTGGGAYIKYDQLVLKYRAFYRSWVNKVEEP